MPGKSPVPPGGEHTRGLSTRLNDAICFWWLAMVGYWGEVETFHTSRVLHLLRDQHEGIGVCGAVPQERGVAWDGRIRSPEMWNSCGCRILVERRLRLMLHCHYGSSNHLQTNVSRPSIYLGASPKLGTLKSHGFFIPF